MARSTREEGATAFVLELMPAYPIITLRSLLPHA